MANQMRLIEFVGIINDDENLPYVGLYDAYDISSITQLDQKHCLITLKDKRSIKACGTLRHLTNRWIYALDKKIHIYEDEFIRPSIMIFHRPENIGYDISYFDEYQLIQFVKSLRPELFTTHTYLFENFSK